MESIEIIRLLERYIQGNPLSALAAGVTLGAFLCLVAMLAIRAVRRRRSPDPTVSKGNVDPLSHMAQDLKLEGAWSQRETEQPNLENERVRDRVHQQEGQIGALKEQIIELSSVCERVTSENLDLRGELKREKKTRRQVQNAAQRYSEQLDRIAQSDGKLWLNAPDGRSVPFLPMTMRRAAIISTANSK